MAQDPHAMDAAVYNELVSRAHLRSIRLTGSKFDLKPEGILLDPDAWRNNIATGLADAFIEPESGSLYGIFSFEVVCRQSRKKVLTVSATYLTNYRIEGGSDETAYMLFLERVGKIATYPYFRALFATLTSQAGLLMQPLPIMGVAPRSIESASDMHDLKDMRPALPQG